MRTHKLWIPLLLAGSYLILVHLTIGLRWEHILVMVINLLAYALHPRTRQLAMDLLPLTTFGIIYDLLRLYPKEWTGPIQVEIPYQVESFLFGFPSQFLGQHLHPFLDLISGVAYSLHLVIPIGFAFLVWFKDRELIRQFCWTILITNLFAFATFILLPTAPPWYVMKYGLVPANWNVPADAVGLLRCDQLLGFPYFETMYQKNAWVFGAIPSMHAAFPFLVLLFAHRLFGKFIFLIYIYMFLVWFAAVYLGHHYVIDLIAGVLYVLLAFWVVEYSRKNYGHIRKPQIEETSQNVPDARRPQSHD